MYYRHNPSRIGADAPDPEKTPAQPPKVRSWQFIVFYGLVQVACVILAFVAASEYQKVQFEHAHHMFKIVDIMYVAGGAAVGQGFLMLLRGPSFNYSVFKSDFAQAFLIFTAIVSTVLISSTWCAMAAIDSYVGFSGYPEAWDATNNSITPHMRWAFGLHTAAVAVAFMSFACKLVFLFPNSMGQL